MFKTTKSKVIAVVIFSVICIITTILLIMYKNIDTNDNSLFSINQDNNQEISNDKIESLNLNGTYNQNDIEFESKEYTTDKAGINYYQIRGMKNKTVQEKINKELENNGLGFYKEYSDKIDEINYLSTYMEEISSFSNTISIKCIQVVHNSNNDNAVNNTKYLNFDLSTGDQISIDKLFVENVPIEKILREAVYNSYIKTQAELEKNLTNDYIVKDYKNVEDEVLKTIYLYENGQINDFCFDPRTIYVYEGNFEISIDMEKYAEYIAIYNRYVTSESLFERNDVGFKNLYTLSLRYNGQYYYQYYDKQSNYYIDININYVDTNPNDFEKKLIEEKIEKINEEINKIKTLVSRDSNKFYMMNYYIEILTAREKNTDELVTKYSERGNTYEMSVNDFYENVEPTLIKYNRNTEENSEKFVYNFNDILKEEPQNLIEYYMIETGEKIVI